MLPATMVPEVLLGEAPNPTFECARVCRDDAIDVFLELACPLHRHLFQMECIATGFSSYCCRKNQRRVQAQREDGWSPRRFGVAPEERHPGGGEPDRSLVHKERDSMPFLNCTRYAAYGIRVMN